MLNIVDFVGLRDFVTIFVVDSFGSLGKISTSWCVLVGGEACVNFCLFFLYLDLSRFWPGVGGGQIILVFLRIL